MDPKFFFIDNGQEYSNHRVYGVVIGEGLTWNILKDIWQEARDTHSQISRELMKREEGPVKGMIRFPLFKIFS